MKAKEKRRRERATKEGGISIKETLSWWVCTEKHGKISTPPLIERKEINAWYREEYES
jgi:hypothetical protein